MSIDRAIKQLLKRAYQEAYARGFYACALKAEARRSKKKMTLQREMRALLAGRLPLPSPVYPMFDEQGELIE